MQFGAHYLPTYIPALDGPEAEFYRRMFEQMELLDQVGFHQVWVTEHHFHEYGGTIPDPAPFLSVVASRTTRIRLGIAIVVLPLHNPLEVAESYAMVDVISGGWLDFGVGRCIDIIRRWRDALGLTVVSGTFYFGGMPQEMALRNIHRFATEVMPAFAEATAIAP